MDADHVLQRLGEIDEMDVADILDDDGRVLPIRQWPKVWRQTISGIGVAEMAKGSGDERQISGLLKKIKWPDKLKSLEMIGRHVYVQAWKEQRELSAGLSISHEETLVGSPPEKGERVA